MNDQTRKLLERALQVSPGDWETRAFLLDGDLADRQFARAAETLRAAPAVPDTEDAQLLKAAVETEINPAEAQATLEAVLARNRACARAYLGLARVYRKRGLRDEARRKYGAATVIDEALSDPDLAAWIEGKTVDPTPAPTPANAPSNLPADLPPEALAEANALVAAGANEEDIPVPVAGEAERGTPALDLGSPAETRRITFADVGGMEDVIERIRMNIVYPFKNPDVFRRFNKRPGGGILLYGPPGCGKTHLARATAGECGAKFISIAVTDVLSKWLGESERHLHQIFEAARHHAPAVVFIDEIDAIGMNRSDAGSYQSTIVNVLLTEMDGIQSANENLMVLAATNAPWRVDNALRRPGRFDRVLFIPPPDAPARASILNLHLRGLPVKGADTAKLAAKSDRFSGADLRAVVERAAEKAIFQEMKTGKPTDLTQALLLDALKETKPSTVEWLETARSYATYANTAGLYDELVAYFER